MDILLNKMAPIPATKEPQYQCCLEFKDNYGLEHFGLMSSHTWLTDPKRLLFVLSRYKFVAKMFSGLNRVLEIGCADAFGTRLVLQEVDQLTAIDFDPVFINDVQNRMTPQWQFECQVHDILEGPVEKGGFDGVYALDLLEHISPDHEHKFVANVVASLTETGILIIGTPSLQSQRYASQASKEGHINCKDSQCLKNLLSQFFHNVFIFSMNDEVVHTGFAPMAHYLLALCCSKKNESG